MQKVEFKRMNNDNRHSITSSDIKLKCTREECVEKVDCKISADVSLTLLELRKIVNDDSHNYNYQNCTRINKLFHNLLNENGNRGFYIKHLEAVIDILKFLSLNLKNCDCQEYLDHLLVSCSQPLLIENIHEIHSYSEQIEQYFNVLSQLLVLSSLKEEIFKISQAISHLLFQTKSNNKLKCLPIDIYHQAMEKSQLPMTLVELSQIILSHDAYKRILELIFIIVSISDDCCIRFLKAGILNILILRMHPLYEPAEDFLPSDKIINLSLNVNSDSHDEIIILTTNIIWSLLRNVPPFGEMNKWKDLNESPNYTLSCNAMWSLRGILRRECHRSQWSGKSLLLRNDLTALILAGIDTLPSWKLIRSGLIDDIVSLFVATNDYYSNSETSWASGIKYNNSEEDVLFKRILILIILKLIQSDAAITIMLNIHIMSAILQLVNPEVCHVSRSLSRAQFWYLSEYAMRTLTHLVPKMPLEFIKHNGPYRMIIMLEWSMMVENDINLMMNLMRTLCSIIIQDCKIILDVFRKQGIIITLIKLINHILNCCSNLTMQHQRLLTLTIISLQIIMKFEIHLQEMYGDEIIKLVLRLLQQCLKEKEGDLQLDQRFLIAIGSYIWESIVSCPIMVEYFINSGGIYLILDLIEDASVFVKCTYLGTISDMCQITSCNPYLHTWRSTNKNEGLLSFLAKTWRGEERMMGVERDSNGCIKDLELPLMGEKQWYNTFRHYLMINRNASPAFIDIVGSIRPKICGIKKLMEINAEEEGKIEEHYKILINDNTPIKDLITAEIIDKYNQLKNGQVWMEVSRFLEQNGVIPLGIDGEVMYMMIEQQRRLACHIKEEQEKLLYKDYKKEVDEEQRLYLKIYRSNLVSLANLVKDIKYIRKTTEKYVEREINQR